jgi:hypothetical protein
MIGKTVSASALAISSPLRSLVAGLTQDLTG